MSRYDGLIIPRSYSEYINKTDAATLLQALQLSGVMDAAPIAQSTKPARSGGIFSANAVITTDNATLSGVPISAGSVVRVLFTAALTGSDTTTGLTLTYNGNTYAVKVGKNGALAAFVASEISSGVFKYLQAYTTLELMFDGTQFIIIGNPVVLSSADYTIYADGEAKYSFSISAELETLSAGAYKTASVNFPFKLPSTKYEVSVIEPSNNWGRLISITTKNNDSLSFGYANHFNSPMNGTSLTIYVSY